MCIRPNGPARATTVSVAGEEYAKSLVDTWLKSDFEGGKSTAKVERMKEIEQQFTASKT
jgi:ribose 5-phosphate isomerase RpiB